MLLTSVPERYVVIRGLYGQISQLSNLLGAKNVTNAFEASHPWFPVPAVRRHLPILTVLY